jgi:hypothetical protein
MVADCEEDLAKCIRLARDIDQEETETLTESDVFTWICHAP